MPKKIGRRTFLGDSLLSAAALSLSPSLTKAQPQPSEKTAVSDTLPDIIDTNINLFEWPFRHLKYGNTQALVKKLRQHRITQAWAGSFDALFHKDLDGVNARLVKECELNGDGMLLPFGTVNLAWPNWEEDLRQCHEVYHMPGIRIYPIYQTFDPTHTDFSRFVQQVTDRGLILQIVGDMEDIRHHHPIIEVREVNLEPLLDIMQKIPQAKIQLLYWNHRVKQNLLEKLIAGTNIVLDTSRIEGAGEVGRLIEGKSWLGYPTVPVERIMFGSHAPYFPVEDNVLKLFESPFTLEQMQAIMHVNARKFFESA